MYKFLKFFQIYVEFILFIVESLFMETTLNCPGCEGVYRSRFTVKLQRSKCSLLKRIDSAGNASGRSLGDDHLILRGGGGWHFLEINILTLKMLEINNLSSSGKKINNLTLTC